mgnify:CR=1 FL=1
MLRIALPSKGRLAEQSLRLLRDAGIPVEPDGRRLRLPLGELRMEVLLARADDIPVLVEDGAAHAGIAGGNQIVESDAAVDVLLRLGFGRCRLALAVPDGRDVQATADLAGRRIATSYPRTVTAFLAARGVDAHLVAISGSVELAPSLGAADAIADLVSSGETLRQNGLRELETVSYTHLTLPTKRIV